MRMKSKLFIALVLAVSPTWAHAVEPPVKAKIRLLSIGDAPRQVALTSNGVSTVVDLPESTRSETIDYQGPALFDLREQGGAGRTLAVELPRITSQLLVVLLPGSLAAKALVIDDGDAAFPKGTVRFSNLALTGLDIAVGDETASVEAGATTVLEFPKNKPAAIVKISGQGGGEIIFSNNWAITPGIRTLVLILPPETGNGRPRVLRLPEILPQKR